MRNKNKPALDAIKALIAKHEGNKTLAAKSLRISPQYLNEILHGRRGISDAMAKRLGLDWQLVSLQS